MNSSKDNHFILVFWQDLMASELHTNLLNRRNDSREMFIIDNDYCKAHNLLYPVRYSQNEAF